MLDADLACVEEHLASVRLQGSPRLEGAARHLLLAGGKRLRPLLSCCIMRLLGQDPAPWGEVIAVVELIHTGSLIHDDVIDAAETRRGRQATHLVFDTHTAILAGDFLLAVALDRLAATGMRPLQRAAAAAIMGVCQGEILEREGLFDVGRGVLHARRVNHLKTAVLFGYAAEAGAILAGASDEVQSGARSFGESLGDAFQTMDDILDWEGDAGRVGKPIGRDLLGGLVTVPVALGCERDPAVREMVSSVLRARQQGAESPFPFERLKDALVRAGAFEEARALAAHDTREALEALSRLPESPWRSWLEEMARRGLERSA